MLLQLSEHLLQSPCPSGGIPDKTVMDHWKHVFAKAFGGFQHTKDFIGNVLNDKNWSLMVTGTTHLPKRVVGTLGDLYSFSFVCRNGCYFFGQFLDKNNETDKIKSTIDHIDQLSKELYFRIDKLNLKRFF